MEARSQWSKSDAGKVEVGIVVHEGKEYAAGGALVTPSVLVCYPHEDGTVRAWDGTTLGTYYIIGTRPAVFFGHRSMQGDRYYYMRAHVDGRMYSLRGFGPGMVAKGKAVKRIAR